jgi:hypothetical protein
MKTINPITIWFNGSDVQANVLSAIAQNDNLQSSANFQYQLLTTDGSPEAHPFFTTVSQGVLAMTGEVYQNWETNDYAYDWVAEQLNLTITGDYIPPVPPQPEPTPEPIPEPEIEE